MLSNADRLAEAEATVKTPLSLCDRLALRPTEEQRTLLETLAAPPPVVNVVADEAGMVHRAVAIGVLWKLITTHGASVVVISASQERASEFMGFLETVTQKIDSQLASISGFPRWNLLQIGYEAGWELRLMPNKAPLIAEKARHALMSVVLGASSRDMAFVEACQALETSVQHPHHVRIAVW